MPERLGDAVLDLRTNDTAFNAGIAQAEGRARQLGGTLDRTSGSSAKLATEMVATGRSAAQMGAGFEAAGQRVTQSAGQQRAGLQQLSFQLNDAATMFALGARPAQIFASQIGQVTQAVQLMTGGTSRLAAFLGGPWGLAITSALVVLTPFIGKLFEGEKALGAVEFASDKLGDAQSILGRVMDSTTLKMKEQTATAIALARAQAAVQLVNAKGRQATARAEQKSISQGGLGDLRVEGNIGGLRLTRANNGQDLVDGYKSGKLTADAVEEQARARLNSGILTPEAYERLSRAVLDDVTEGANVKEFEDTLDALNGDSAAARRVFGAPVGSRARSGPRGSSASGPRERSEGERTADFDSQTTTIERQTLQARLSLASSAEDRADIQNELRNLEREQRVTEIEASDLGRERKDALIAQVDALLGVAPKIDEQGNLILSANQGLEGQIIARQRASQVEQDAQALADEQFRAQADALQLQLSLADTEADRKAIALRLLDAEDAHLRSRLEAVILSDASNAAERQRAQVALDALNATAGDRREGVSRANETETERYLRDLNRTPAQINEALDGIAIDGLEALNDGLVDAITGARSLGDVFSRVADQIIADLLRIAIQRAIIQPLANALFGPEGGGSGGGGGGIFGSLFGGGGGGGGGIFSFLSSFVGGRATGGPIPTGKFAVVGENGPELAFGGTGGLGIMSNPNSRALLGAGGGTTVPIAISIDATGADAAALERVRAELSRMREELPGTIVSTVQEADQRRILNLGSGR